jgi:hypothetical protein
MNGPSTTSHHLGLTSETLAMFIDLRLSTQKLVIHHSSTQDGYNSNFIADAKLVTNFLMRKLNISDLDATQPPERDFDCDFWYTLSANPQFTVKAPSDICEEGGTKVADYVVQNQKFIVQIRERIVIVADQAEDNLYDSDDDAIDEHYYDIDE